MMSMGKGAIVVDTKQIDKLALELKGFEQEVATAARYAINRTIDHVMTVTAREVSKVYNIKASEIKLPKEASKKEHKNAIVKIFIKAPGPSDLTSHIEYTGRTLTMMHFGIKPQKKFSIPSKISPEVPVKVKIKKSGGYKKLNIDPKPFVFMFPTNKNLNVWHRTGKTFYPVEPLRTLSVPQMITNEDITKSIAKAAEEMLGNRLEHEIIRIMTSTQKRIRK